MHRPVIVILLSISVLVVRPKSPNQTTNGEKAWSYYLNPPADESYETYETYETYESSNNQSYYESYNNESYEYSYESATQKSYGYESTTQKSSGDESSLSDYSTDNPNNTDTSEEKKPTNKYDVIIVGAGTAGLAAAQRLLEKKFSNILVLEARDRVGGRIHTVKFGGEKVDLGAQFVYAYPGNNLFDMTKNMGMYYHPPNRESDLLSWGGKKLEKSILNEMMSLPFHLLARENSSFAHWFIPKAKAYMSSKGVPMEDRRLYLDAARKLFTVHNGGDMPNTSAWGIINYRETSYGRSQQWTNGFTDFISILLGEAHGTVNLGLRKKILFGKDVIGVEFEPTRTGNSGTLTVRCSDYSTYRTMHVILTLPLGVLKELPSTFFDKPFPPSLARVIKYLPVGYTEKIFLEFDQDITDNRKVTFGMDSDMKNRFSSTVYKKGTWPVQLTGLCPTRSASTLINSWITGDNAVAMDRVSDEQLIDGVLAVGRTILNKELPRPLSVLRSKWANDIYSRGSYSYRSVESETQKVSHGDLFERIWFGRGANVLQFAGEATSELHYGTVHGALETGWDAAARMMKILITPVHKKHVNEDRSSEILPDLSPINDKWL